MSDKDGAIISNRVCNSNVETKRMFWPVFEEMIRSQFEHGGEKYAMDNQPDKEVTDWVCELAPGKTGADWVLQTIAKYCGRYRNFKRERDLLKIAAYAFIMWLKMGYHLETAHDEDVSQTKKDVEEV